MIKAVIFDVDGVLIDSFEANLKFFQGLMSANGYRPPTREEFPKLFHMNMHDVIKKMTQLENEKEIDRIWEMGRGRAIPYDLDLLKNPEGLEEVVKKLANKFLLGIVTSRIRESIYESPRLAKLQDYFEVEVSYQDTENHKPHPEPLFFAAQRLKAKPEECVYIGDVENDIKAAKAAGMKIIIYSKNEFEQADASTSSFRDLPKIINEL